MKILLSFAFLALSALTVFAQTEQPKEVFLNSKKMKARIAKQEFSDIPQNVRDCHARGTFLFYVKVDEEGNAKSAKIVSGLCKDVNEYLEKTIAAWKFRPLKVDETKTAFRGVVEVPFCYGSFRACDW